MSNRKLRSELEELRKRVEQLEHEKNNRPAPIFITVPAPAPFPHAPLIDRPAPYVWPQGPGDYPFPQLTCSLRQNAGSTAQQEQALASAYVQAAQSVPHFKG